MAITVALPSRPLTSIALTDADSDTALKYVTWKLSDAGVERLLQFNDLKIVEKLGGRISDLDVVSRVCPLPVHYPAVLQTQGQLVAYIDM